MNQPFASYYQSLITDQRAYIVCRLHIGWAAPAGLPRSAWGRFLTGAAQWSAFRFPPSPPDFRIPTPRSPLPNLRIPGLDLEILVGAYGNLNGVAFNGQILDMFSGKIDLSGAGRRP